MKQLAAGTSAVHTFICMYVCMYECVQCVQIHTLLILYLLDWTTAIGQLRIIFQCSQTLGEEIWKRL